MELYEVLKKEDRKYSLEKEILNDFYQILKTDFTLKEIEDTLEQNKFDGVYVLDEDRFSLVKDDIHTLGFYSKRDRVIVLRDKLYKPEIGVHEFGHAFLNFKSSKELKIDKNICIYGQGLEEGAMTTLMCSSNIRNIDNTIPNLYSLQVKLFKELMVLYGYSNINEYPNLLIHMLKRPEEFLTLIKNIYYNILKENYSETDELIAMRSALQMIQCTDIVTNKKLKGLNDFSKILLSINCAYLIVADENIRSGRKQNILFPIPNNLISGPETDEERLLYFIFNNEYYKIHRTVNYIDQILMFAQSTLEDYTLNSDDKKLALK